MKNFDHLLIFGAGSSIASHVIPELTEFSKSISLVYRKMPTVLGGETDFDNRVCEFNFDDTSQNFDLLLSDLKIKSTNTLLILNFIGQFGEVESMDVISPDLILRTMEANLFPFLNLIKLLKNAASESVMIGFSGGGIGGPNLDRTSLGYLGGKGAMAFICEAISNELHKQSKSVSLVAPGPFPSQMQAIVAQSTFPEFEDNRKKSSQVMRSAVNPDKLICLIKWIIENPQIANGRILSALHDNPALIRDSTDHGFLRRVF